MPSYSLAEGVVVTVGDMVDFEAIVVLSVDLLAVLETSLVIAKAAVVFIDTVVAIVGAVVMAAMSAKVTTVVIVTLWF